jgi:VWFA-related protein
LLAAVALEVSGQQGPTISSRVNVVTLFATVHDADGKVVKDLTPDDFVLLEDGVPQKIDYFSQESNLPLTIGLLVDTSRSQTGVLEQERRASYTFLDQVLREGKDQAFVVHFDIEVAPLQGPTSSRDALELALARLKIPERNSTLVFSAIILLSDGVAYKENTSITEAIEYAQRADTIITPDVR